MLLNTSQNPWFQFVVTSSYKCVVMLQVCETSILQNTITATNAIQNLRDSGRVHLSSHRQPIEPLHVTDGFGQNLSRLHGGHLSARLRQVAKLAKPCLQEDDTKLFLLSLTRKKLLNTRVCFFCVTDTWYIHV